MEAWRPPLYIKSAAATVGKRPPHSATTPHQAHRMSESQTPSNTASPQKRAMSADEAREAKRLKTEEPNNPTVDDILQDDFDMANFEIPDDSTLLQMPQFPQTPQQGSAQGTPQQMNLELPELPSDPQSANATPANTALNSAQHTQNTQNTTSSTPAVSSATATPSLPEKQIASQEAQQQTPQQQQQPQQQSQMQQPPAPQQVTSATNVSVAPLPSTNTNGNTQADASGKPSGPADPDKLSDALLSAGVDLKAEEALLNSSTLPTKPSELSNTTAAANQPIIINTPFLDPRQLATFMNKVVSAHGLKPNTEDDAALIQLVTYAAEDWMKNILTNAIVLSRHRRRSIKNKGRSEITVAMREIALNNKQAETTRATRKRDIGMEKKNEVNDEEIQHKATNATVAMMTGTKKKKYDWMSAGSQGSKNSLGDVSLRFREAREEPGLVVRDLLSSLEKKRSGVEKTLAKGYAKLKD